MSTAAADPHVRPAVAFLAALNREYAGNFAVRLWTGAAWQPAPGPPAFTLVLKHAGALRAMCWPGDRLALGESYIFDDYDIEGDILAFAGWLRHVVATSDSRDFRDKLPLVWELARLPDAKNPRDPARAGRPTARDRTPADDREAIAYTYDLPGAFYALWLDRHMQYTCGYFASPDEGLDAAQERKLDYICRKLRLQPGERFVDYGCGWGGLIIHAAKHYGVHATGVTLAGEQAKWCEAAIDAAGVRDRVKVVYGDYRDFVAPGTFDKAASVGMSEHVGVNNLPVFLGRIHDNLRPGGAYLHHCITLRPNTPAPHWTPFVDKYVFPNGDLQTLLQVQEAACAAGFEVRDLENLREHYVHTLERWVRNLEANRVAAVDLVGEVSYRVFRVYMAGATLGFESGVYALNQFLLSKPDGAASRLPLTRADWYR